MKFRKRPIIIDAMQLRWETWNEMCDFAGVGSVDDGKPEGCYVDAGGKISQDITNRIGLRIPTLEGEMLAIQNDWVIRGVKGELYPCKPDIFEVTYESVDG